MNVARSQTPQQNIVSSLELKVLSVLKNHSSLNAEEPLLEIAEIISNSGVRDSEEILRALYTLEGKSLVTPEPAGDFTSHHWKITDIGRKALDLFTN